MDKSKYCTNSQDQETIDPYHRHLAAQLLEHIFSILKYNMLTEEQHGFCQFRLCETQLIVTIHDLAENLGSGNQTDIILLDFTKTFGKVPHGHLCSKLDHLGINGLLHYIDSKGHKQRD